jgi:hypothetical protein
MARLPIPGGDNNKWGTILNDCLKVSHNSDGTLKVELTDASKLQGTEVSSTAPTDNQVLTYSNSTGQWEAQTLPGGVALGTSNPQALAASPNAGGSTSASRQDHQHPQGPGVLSVCPIGKVGPGGMEQDGRRPTDPSRGRRVPGENVKQAHYRWPLDRTRDRGHGRVELRTLKPSASAAWASPTPPRSRRSPARPATLAPADGRP